MPDRPDREAPEPRGLKLWVFRLAAATLIPTAFLIALELGLRLFGFGYPSGFLVPVADREGIWTTNQRFGQRFFPRHLARTPVPLEVASGKENTYRIFVIGGSAARGTPDSAYNFGRHLEVPARGNFPEHRFRSPQRRHDRHQLARSPRNRRRLCGP